MVVRAMKKINRFVDCNQEKEGINCDRVAWDSHSGLVTLRGEMKE